MKEIKITPPDGYEIDKDNSTFEKIVFKKIKKELPKRWEDLGRIDGYCLVGARNEKLIEVRYNDTHDINKNIFFSKEQAQASIALAQLTQLREVYRQGWKPDYGNRYQNKFVIERAGYEYRVNVYSNYNYFLSFQSRKIAEQFLDNFRDLIEQASPLLF